MKQLYVSLLLLLVAYTSTYAQRDFRKGYIIQNSDTLRGYVDYRGDSKSAQVTTFKPSMDGGEQRYAPADIAGYGFDNENRAYESRQVTLGDSVNSKKQMLFLNVLVRGKASIYYYRDSYTTDHYYLQKDTLFLELTNRQYQKTDSRTGTVYEGSDKKYLGTLAFAFNDCQAISTSQLMNVRFTQSDLIRITNKYNQCGTPDAANVTYTKRKEKANVTIGLVLVYTQADLKFSGAGPLASADFQNESHFGGGIFVNIPMPILNEKLSLQTELLYIPAKFTATYTETKGSSITDYDFLFDLAYVKLPLQMRYVYPKGAIRPFVNAGYMMGYAVKDANKQHVIYNNYRKPTDSDAIDAVGFRSYTGGATVGAGLSHLFKGKAISLELRYERNGGFSKPIVQGSTMHNFNVMLSCGY